MSDQASTAHRIPTGSAADDARIETFGLLLEAHSRLVARLSAELEEQCGLSLQWFEVLVRLARTSGECLNATQLAADIALSSGGATRLVDRMETQGLVVRRPGTVDRRVVRVCLTPAGRDKLAEALPVHIDGLERNLAAPLADNLPAFAQHVRDLRDANT